MATRCLRPARVELRTRRTSICLENLDEQSDGLSYELSYQETVPANRPFRAMRSAARGRIAVDAFPDFLGARDVADQVGPRTDLRTSRSDLWRSDPGRGPHVTRPGRSTQPSRTRKRNTEAGRLTTRAVNIYIGNKLWTRRVCNINEESLDCYKREYKISTCTQVRGDQTAEGCTMNVEHQCQSPPTI